MSTRPIVVIGGGLAGTEAAYQIASRGLPCSSMRCARNARRWRIRPPCWGSWYAVTHSKRIPSLQGMGCSKRNSATSALLILQAADASRVPAGAALAVDRTQFAQYLTTTIQHHPNITLIREEVMELPAGPDYHCRDGSIDVPGLDGAYAESAREPASLFLRCSVTHCGG